MSDILPLTNLTWTRRTIPASLHALAEQVQAGTIDLNADMVNAMNNCGAASLPPLVREAVRTGNWEDVVATFGEARGADDLFYLGPMQANETGAVAPGLLIGTRDPVGSEVFNDIAAATEHLGTSLFGSACQYHDRVVEFYDIDLTAGPLRAARFAPIALFSPFYLGGWKDTERQWPLRRTIMFSNVVASRFFNVTRPSITAAALRIDGRPPTILEADETLLRQAIAAWLCLHELMHGSGPAPFFSSWTGKARLGDTYGVVEEARVDMTAFIAAGMIGHTYGRVAQELILLERLLRSGRRGLRLLARGEVPALDDAHGLSWLGSLTDRAIRISRDSLTVDLSATEEQISAVLAAVYEVEQQAAAASDPAGILAVHGPRLQREISAPAESDSPVLKALSRLDIGPDAVTLAE